jgi:hypothetical protein
VTAHYLLLGAGFSRNWGGWLANEAFEYLLSYNLSPSVRQTLIDNRTDGFEGALAVLQSKWRTNASTRPDLRGKRSAGEVCKDQRGGDINFNALRRLLENPQLARLRRLLAMQRAAVESAFRPYRPRATCVQSALNDAQREIDLALNTS